jgi:hypothetical protein
MRIDPHDEVRVARLLQVASVPREAAGLPPSLEASLCAFAEGAAARRTRARRMGWIVGLPLCLGAAAASIAAVGAWVGVESARSAGRVAMETPKTGPLSVDTRVAASPPREARTGPKSPPIVVALRSAQDWRSRRSAAVALAAHTSDSTEKTAEIALESALQGDPDWRVREAALTAIVSRGRTEGAHGGASAVRSIAKATEDPHLPIRLAAIRALEAKSRSQDYEAAQLARDALLSRLDRDPDWRLREAALAALLGSPEGQRAAAIALGDRHRKLRDLARAAMARR